MGLHMNPLALLTNNILCPGNHDNDFCPGWLKSDFNRGIIFGQYPSERLVQFSLEDAIRDLLDTGTAILPPSAILSRVLQGVSRP